MTSISIGPPTNLTLDTEYALPAKACSIQSTQVIQISLDRITWTNLPASATTGQKVAGGWIRCHVDDAIVVLKALRNF